LEAGAEVFMEKGFDQATMTEIAARSGTAIGSLYRFFPSKASLADALLLRHAQQAAGGLAALEPRAAALGPERLADALLDFMLAQQSRRSSIAALVDARGGSGELRARFREAIRQGMARLLRKAAPRLTPARARAIAATLLHLLKGVATAMQEEPAMRRMLLAEIRGLARLYLSSAMR
jgi:AcrR family transcriptional regulator